MQRADELGNVRQITCTLCSDSIKNRIECSHGNLLVCSEYEYHELGNARFAWHPVAPSVEKLATDVSDLDVALIRKLGLLRRNELKMLNDAISQALQKRIWRDIACDAI